MLRGPKSMFPGVWVPVPTEFLRSPWYKKLSKNFADLKESGGRLMMMSRV